VVPKENGFQRKGFLEKKRFPEIEFPEKVVPRESGSQRKRFPEKAVPRESGSPGGTATEESSSHGDQNSVK